MPARVDKAVIPAAGLGTRFLPATKSQPKEMLPLVDKPTIQYVVEEAVAAGLSDVLMVTGRGKRTLEDHFDRSFELEYHLAKTGKDEALAQVQAIAELAQMHFVRQREPLGLGHAVGLARQHVGDKGFAVLLGDDVMHQKSHVLAEMLRLREEKGGSVLALQRVAPETISSYGCARVAGDGPVVEVEEIVEKPAPDDAPSDLAVMGRYVLDPAVFEALDQVKPGHGGEIQLTDAIALLIEGGEPVYGFVFSGGRFDVGKKLDYLKATVELALERDDLGPPLRAFLAEILEARD